jgi:GH35 family endo-1,4-beta-xylanase
MKIAKSLTLLAVSAFIGFNASAQAVDPQQTAQKETAEIKTNVTGITPNEESQILSVETEHAKSIRDAQSTITDKNAMKTQCKQLCNSRDAKIKAILTADQYKQYLKVEKAEKKQG